MSDDSLLIKYHSAERKRHKRKCVNFSLRTRFIELIKSKFLAKLTKCRPSRTGLHVLEMNSSHDCCTFHPLRLQLRLQKTGTVALCVSHKLDLNHELFQDIKHLCMLSKDIVLNITFLTLEFNNKQVHDTINVTVHIWQCSTVQIK